MTAVPDISSTSAPPATTHALPQELLELVFEHLGSNFYTLRNCSLVCREWTLPSQRIIFRSVYLSAETHSKTWSDIFRASSHIGGFVRELTVLGVACSGAISHEFITHLSTGLPFFPHLTRVIVRPSIGVSNDVLDILCRVLKTYDLPVPAFLLYFNTIHRFHDVFSHFCGLPVHHVILDELGRLPDPLSSLIGTCETRLPWLKRLELAPGSVDTLKLFIDWLADTRTILPALQELRLNLWSVSELRELCNLVHFGELPRTIELFQCHVEACHNTDVAESSTFPLPLVQFSHVKLTAGIHKDVNGRHLTCFSSCVRLWAAILQYNTRFCITNALTEITLTFNKDVDMKSPETLSAWWELDRALAYPAFRGVRTVQFEDLRGDRLPFTDPNVVTKTRLLLPGLAARRIIPAGT